MGWVGIDIGGSGVRAGLVDAAGAVTDVRRVPLPDREVATVLDACVAAVAGRATHGIGVGVPGFVRGRTVAASPNFPTFRDLDLGAALEARLGLPVTVENDANAAALGAWTELGGEDLVLLTLGTGVGGGVVTAGKLLRGSTGTGAELGHIHVGGDAPCNCGGVGCLELWASTTGLLRLARDAGQAPANGEAVVDAARAGEAWAQGIVAESGRHLGVGLVTLVNIFAPRTVAVAGGLSQARDLLAPPAEGWLRRHGVPPSVEGARVVWLGPADHLAIAGAARSARGGT